MKPEMVDALLMWGDRSNRDTAHLLDIAIAGTIEQNIGHGTVTLRPARLEEIVSRIGPRERDPDGGWKVTLLPPEDPHSAVVRPADVLAYVRAEYGDPDTSRDEDIASFVLAASVPGVTLRQLGMQGFAMFVEWCDEQRVDN